MKCGQCGLILDSLPEGGGEYRCPNCGHVMRKAAPAAPENGTAATPDMTASASHLKIAKTVNVGFGDFASVLAATNASKIVTAEPEHDEPDRTRTATSSKLNVVEPDDDDVLSQIEVYDEDDEYARIQADIAARKKALEVRAAELDAREKHLNKKLDEIISEKEFLRTGIEKTDMERASYLKQKDAMDVRRADLEKEFAARKASLDARAAEIERKAESLAKTRAALEDLKRELDSSLNGDQSIVDHTTSSVSIPYSAKLLRQNNKLSRTVRIQKRILFCLAALVAILVVLLFVKESTHPSDLSGGLREDPETLHPRPVPTETVSAPSADALNPENLPAPENEQSGGGL